METITLTLTANEVRFLRGAIDTHLTHADSFCGFDLLDEEKDTLERIDQQLATWEVFR